MSAFRAGFVSILGLPNSGKSTLLNALTGQKLAIVARKPQTTRTTIQGVLTTDEAQVVFIDTPGIHKSDNLFNKRMMDAVRAALEDRDVLLFIADSVHEPGDEDAHAVSILRKTEAPVVLVLNKIDRLSSKATLLARIEQYRSLQDFEEYVPISALTGEGVEELTKAIIARLPERDPFFPADYITDQPERFLVAELIREKILELTRQEVPHSVAVLVESWEQTPTLTRIHATIYVERDGQKAIIIGARGASLKTIGTAARLEAEHLLGRRIYLELYVKVRPNWREDPRFLSEIDWRSMAGL